MAEHTGWVLGEPGGAPTSSPTNVGSQDEAGQSARQTTHGACSSVQSEPSAPPASLSPKVADPNARTHHSHAGALSGGGVLLEGQRRHLPPCLCAS